MSNCHYPSAFEWFEGKFEPQFLIVDTFTISEEHYVEIVVLSHQIPGPRTLKSRPRNGIEFGPI